MVGRYKDPEYMKKYKRRPEVKARDKISSKKRRQRPEVKAVKKEYDKKYHIRNREKKILITSTWQKNNRIKYNKRLRKWAKTLKYSVLAEYSKKQSNSDVPCCSCCGENEFLIFLSIDHISGRKNTDDYTNTGIKLGGRGMYAKLKKLGFPPGYCVLCFNCNSARDNQPDKICPHQRNKQ